MADIWPRQGTQFIHLSLSTPSDNQSKRFDNDLDIKLNLSNNFILDLIDAPFSSCFLIGTEKLYILLCFLLNIETDLRIILTAL